MRRCSDPWTSLFMEQGERSLIWESVRGRDWRSVSQRTCAPAVWEAWVSERPYPSPFHDTQRWTIRRRLVKADSRATAMDKTRDRGVIRLKRRWYPSWAHPRGFRPKLSSVPLVLSRKEILAGYGTGSRNLFLVCHHWFEVPSST